MTISSLESMDHAQLVAPSGPTNDPAFAALPEKVREAVLYLLRSFRIVDGSENKKAAIKVQAAHFCGKRGFSAVSLTRKYYAYCATGDWKVLVDKAQAGVEWWESERIALPRDFVEFWKGRCERNQRKSKPAWRKLKRQWQEWRAGNQAAAIPGYDVCPEDGGRGYPAGWSYENLMRCLPSKFELVAARIGPAAAAPYRPKVPTTRVGLRVGQYLVFDDMWHDFKVNVPGQMGARRLLQLHAQDYFSGCQFARGLKPCIYTEKEQEERIKEVEMVFLLAYVFSQFGYLPSGTTCLVERGTAAIRELVEQHLFDFSGGKIRVERNGMEGRAATPAAYNGRGKGNFRFKAALESLHNLIHNETADMDVFPGQTGSNSRLNCPEDLAGREKHNDRLLLALETLPVERRALLRNRTFLSLDEAIWKVTWLHDVLINDRTDHEMEGWVKAGLLLNEWRINPQMPWMSGSVLDNMTEQERALAVAVINSNPLLTRSRRLSPREVWDSGRTELVRMRSHEVALLLKGSIPPREVRVGDDHLITFECDAVDSNDSFRFYPVLNPGGGAARRLPAGEKFGAILNPFIPDKLHLFNAAGGYIGEVEREQRTCRSDAEGLKRAMGRAAKTENELLNDLVKRGRDVIKQREADAKWNAKVLTGAPVTIEEKASARQTAKLVTKSELTEEDRAAANLTAPAAAPAPSVLDEFSTLFND